MLKMVLAFNHKAKDALSSGVKIETILSLDVRERIARAKYTSEDQFEQYYKDTLAEIDSIFAELQSKEAEA